MLITNATIFTNSQSRPWIEDGAVYIEDGDIVEVGEKEDIEKKYRYEKKNESLILNAKGHLLMPGMVNLHTHLCNSLMRGLNLNDSDPLVSDRISKRSRWKYDKTLDLESVYYSALVGAIESVKSGVTMVFDHHSSPNAIKDSLNSIYSAVSSVGIRASLSYEISDRSGKQKAIESIEENAAFRVKTSNLPNDMIHSMIGLNSSFTVSDDTIKEIRKVIPDKEIDFHINLAEGVEDNKDSYLRYGMSVANRLARCGILNSNTIAAHCVNINDEDKDVLAMKNTIIVHNPESDMRNAIGKTDIKGLLGRGLTVGLGDAGFGYNMFQQLRISYLLYSDWKKEISQFFSKTISSMLLKNNYSAVFRLTGIPLGKIEEGYKADLVILDYPSPTPVESGNFIEHLITAGGIKSKVDYTIINGKIVVREGKVVTVSEEEIFETTRVLSQRILSYM